MVLNFTQKYYDIIEGPEKHSNTMATYISDNVVRVRSNNRI